MWLSVLWQFKDEFRVGWPFWRLLKALGFRMLVLVFWLGLDLVVVYLMLYFGVLY